MLPDTMYGALENLKRIRKPVVTAPSAVSAVAPVTEESIRANLGIPVTGGFDPAYLAARGAVPSTTALAPAAQPATTLSPTYTIQSRPISDKVLSLLSDYTRQMNRAPISAEDIMESPEYEAMQKVNELELGRGLAALSRRFSALGTLRGTPAMQTMGSLTAEAKTQLGSLVPQLVQSAYARQQERLGNTMNALKALAGLEDTAYSQGLSEFSATAPYRYDTIAGQREAELMPYKKELLQAQTSQAKASATKAGTKETDYKQAFIQSAYQKLINGQTLTDDERKALNLDTTEKDVVGEAMKLAQNDIEYLTASDDEKVAIIEKYIAVIERLRGKSGSTATASPASGELSDEEIRKQLGY